jgi:hypothetical protein
MGITTASVVGYLYLEVGKGSITRSDILFSIGQETREAIELTLLEVGRLDHVRSIDVCRFAASRGRDLIRDDVEVYMDLRDARVALGDMYELLRAIEVDLHNAVEGVLTAEYGPADWWTKGVPEDIRATCAANRERDSGKARVYCYTKLIDLKRILDSRWGVFKPRLPKKLADDKVGLLAALDKMNPIRNSVMHPVRDQPPSESDFEFVRTLAGYLRLAQWNVSK